jgi:hypothetical protein
MVTACRIPLIPLFDEAELRSSGTGSGVSTSAIPAASAEREPGEDMTPQRANGFARVNAIRGVA